MTVKSFTHFFNTDGFEEAFIEFELPWYDFWSNPFLECVRHSDGLWRYKETGQALSDSHLVLIHAYLTTC